MRRLFSKRQRKILQLIAGNICGSCGTTLEKGFHADHVKPFSVGGETILKNGQALCEPCNIAKGVTDGRT